MTNIFQKAFAQGLQEDRPARDKLLFAIGTTAIIWYILAILVLGLAPFVIAGWRTLPAESEPDAAADATPAKRPPRSTAKAGEESAETEPPAATAAGDATTEDAPEPLDLWQFMAFSITTIAGTLATFVGMVLGFGQVPEAQRAGQNVPQTTPMQQAAAWAYFGSLVLGLSLWALHTFLAWSGAPLPELDPAISRLGQSILGLFGGVLAVVLNVKS